MNDHLSLAQQTLLEPAGLSQNDLTKILESILGHQVDAADLYFQAIWHEGWGIEDGIVKNGSYTIDRGVGVRAMCGEKTGFAYSDDIILPALEDAAKSARSIAYHGGAGKLQAWQRPKKDLLYPSVNPLPSLTATDKIALLQKVDRLARQKDSRVKQVMANLSGLYEVMMVMATDGSLAADLRPLVRLDVSVIVEQNGQRESAYSGCGARLDYSMFDDECIEQTVNEAVRQALVALDAKPAPAGVMPVVLGPGWPGILLHEAIGHGLEGDFNRKGSSAFSGRIGERIAAPGCTIVDDATVVNRRGSLQVDDEGTPAQRTVLIEDGILRSYMQDKFNAGLMGEKSTGNGRRESYAHLPMPRMTNTYMLAGQYTPEEIIQSVEKGLYAPNFGGGQVDITSGKFVFSTSEAYMIENGKVTYPVKGAMLIGCGSDVLTKVSMVGNDLALDSGVGICGKEGQSVPVGVGQPTLKIDELTVGGTNA